MTGMSSGSIRCLHWDFRDLESLNLAWPLVKPKSFSKVVEQNMELTAGEVVQSGVIGKL